MLRSVQTRDPLHKISTRAPAYPYTTEWTTCCNVILLVKSVLAAASKAQTQLKIIIILRPFLHATHNKGRRLRESKGVANSTNPLRHESNRIQGSQLKRDPPLLPLLILTLSFTLLTLPDDPSHSSPVFRPWHPLQSTTAALAVSAWHPAAHHERSLRRCEPPGCSLLDLTSDNIITLFVTATDDELID
jgi:hypothetical protein